MKRNIWQLAIILAFSHQAAAQQRRAGYLRYLFSPDTTRVVRIVPSVGVDARLSFFGNKSVAFKGVRGGIRFGKNRNRLTVAYRWFSFEDNVGLINYTNLKEVINRRYLTELDGYYYALSYQHILINTYRFAFGITSDIGIGATYDKGLSFGKNINIFKRTTRFVPAQLGLYSEFKATRFAGVSARVGYRWVQNYKMQPSISKLYLGLGARLYVGSIIRHFKKRANDRLPAVH